MKKQNVLYTSNLALIIAIIFTTTIPVTTFANHTSSTEGMGRSRGEINQWRERSNELRNRINDLDDDAVEDVPIPILFGITRANLTRNFGDPRSGGREHEGLDIMAPKGAPIVSPTEAVVLRTGTGDSSGKYVYTANPGDETFAYMHLDEIADIDEGDVLEAGDLIGYVGNTGNASGGATHLHFEIQEENDATDPYPRLTKVFSPEDKIEYLEKIIDESDDEDDFVELMINLYSRELLAAKALGVDLPDEITDVMKDTVVATVVSTGGLSANLTLGSRGTAVVTLQNFLILQGVGSASKIKADGSFGPMTQKALAEYQASVGIKPASGYYGPITRAYIQNLK